MVYTSRDDNEVGPFIIGRKNGLLSCDPGGALAGANPYSLIETAKKRGIEPH